jgi:hypothetical protein
LTVQVAIVVLLKPFSSRYVRVLSSLSTTVGKWIWTTPGWTEYGSSLAGLAGAAPGVALVKRVRPCCPTPLVSRKSPPTHRSEPPVANASGPTSVGGPALVFGNHGPSLPSTGFWVSRKR